MAGRCSGLNQNRLQEKSRRFTLRGTVIYGKLSLGSESEGGDRLSRLQDRLLFVYLTDVLATHARGDPLPLLTYALQDTE